MEQAERASAGTLLPSDWDVYANDGCQLCRVPKASSVRQHRLVTGS